MKVLSLLSDQSLLYLKGYLGHARRTLHVYTEINEIWHNGFQICDFLRAKMSAHVIWKITASEMHCTAPHHKPSRPSPNPPTPETRVELGVETQSSACLYCNGYSSKTSGSLKAKQPHYRLLTFGKFVRLVSMTFTISECNCGT